MRHPYPETTDNVS